MDLSHIYLAVQHFFLSRLGHDAGTQSRWYYDSSDGTCKEFEYKGMKGNGNRFLTRQDCIASCQPSQVSIVFIIDVRGHP